MNRPQLRASDIGDVKSFWKAMGQRAVGVSLVTSAASSGPAGFLCLSVAHVSDNPPIMSISISKRTSALSTVLEARHFAINLLAAGSEDLAMQFSGKSGPSGAERFTKELWGEMRTGVPILLDCAGAIECELVTTFEQETAVLVLGKVVGFTENPDKMPLLMFRGSFASIAGDITSE